MRYRVCTDGRGLMKNFLRVPELVYREDALYVRPFDRYIRLVLDPARNPYFASASVKLFVCTLDDRPLARVAIIVNPAYGNNGGRPRALFGFFEAMNDQDAVNALFEEAFCYLRSLGVFRIEGPFNPHHYAELGLQLDRFDVPPTFFQTHNPPYYLRLLENAGFKLVKVLHTRRNGSIRETLRQNVPASLAYRDTLRVRHLNGADLPGELERIRLVFNDAFRDNWAFLPVTLEEYLFNARFLRYVTDPELSLIVEEHGEPLGALQCVLDINPLLRECRGGIRVLPLLKFLLGRTHVRTLVVFALGVRPSARSKGVATLLFEAFAQMASRYDAVETTWMSPDNTLVIRIAERLGLRPDKQFGIYAKELARIQAPSESDPSRQRTHLTPERVLA
jgi:GNAT superfamily N-acetyltransferase